MSRNESKDRAKEKEGKEEDRTKKISVKLVVAISLNGRLTRDTRASLSVFLFLFFSFVIYSRVRQTTNDNPRVPRTVPINVSVINTCHGECRKARRKGNRTDKFVCPRPQTMLLLFGE